MIVAAVLLCSFLIYKEWKRQNRARLLLRILSIILLVGSLLFLVIPITYQFTRTTNTKKLLLLTKGFENKLSKTERYFTLDSSVLQQVGSKRVKYLPDLPYYLRTHPEVSGLNVFGYGLSSDDLSNLRELSYEFQAAPEPSGFISVSWPNQVPLSSALNVQGVYDNKGNTPIQLLLEGAGSRLDSTTIAASQKTSFSLSTRPQQLGNAIYHLTVKRDDKQLTTEKIPFRTIEVPKMRIMVLASSPDFEFKFLRNWLFEDKYPAYFRTRISKDKFSTEQLNTAAKQAENFHASMFKEFDLIIADDEELAALPPSERATLNSRVSDGMGLLLRISEAKPVSSFGKLFLINAAVDSITTSIVPVITGDANKLKAIPASQPLFVEADPAKVSLVENAKGKILISSKLYGTGKIAATTISSTYSWMLAGASADYAKYWSHIINKTARKIEKKLIWQVKPQFPVTKEQGSIAFQTKTGSVLPKFTINKELRSTQQHPLLPFYWQSFGKMDHPGWNEFKVDDHASEEFFVYKPEDWTTVKLHGRLTENTAFAGCHNKDNTKQVDLTEKVTEEVSKWWFFGLFLISISFLWLEAKLLH